MPRTTKTFTSRQSIIRRYSEVLRWSCRGQAGGMIQFSGQPASSLGAAVQCPSNKDAQIYQFVMIPAARTIPGPNSQLSLRWNPATETAYGSVDISASNGTVTFNNIHQFTLPSAGGRGTPSTSVSSPKTGVCGETYLGNTISIPGQTVVRDPAWGRNRYKPPLE